jgi:DNA-binding LytR/AlgR family response regulator
MERILAIRRFYAPDLWIFAIAIPLISAVNFYLTYSNIQFDSFFAIRYLVDTLQGYLAWILVREIIFWLDRRLPYTSGIGKRIMIQVGLTTLAGLTFIALSTEILSLSVKKEPAPLGFYAIDLIIIGIWFFVINGVYIGIYFYRSLEMAKKKKPEIEKKGILVKTGNQSILVHDDEIAMLIVEEDYVSLHTFGGKKYLLDQSLDKLEQSLPSELFFRINRQAILHRKAVKGFLRIDNGKLKIQLAVETKSNPELSVSRIKAAAFRTWFLPS